MAAIHQFLLSLFILSGGCYAVGRVRERIYVTLYDSHPCFRILNGTTQVGCQSGRDGSNGILHFIQNDSDIDYVRKDPGGHGPFIVAMKMRTFRNKTLVMQLYDSGKLNGMLVIQTPLESNKDQPFSEDARCPNEASSLYKSGSSHQSCDWNPHGTGLRFVDFKIPISLVSNETEIDILINKCYAFNKPVDGQPPKYPLCAVQLFMFNSAAGSAVTCLRRNTLVSGLDNPTTNCDKIGDYNIHALLPPTNKSTPLGPNSVLMLAARMDSFSMFSDYDPGAESAISNVIAMLAMIEVFGRNKEVIGNISSETGKYLMPVLFNGESMDYIGSSRMAWDMSNNKFPAPLSESIEDQPALVSIFNLGLILELNQVALPNEGYFLHTDPTSLQDPHTNAVVTNASNLLKSFGDGAIKSVDGKADLPPSSSQRFLLVNRTIPAIVITDHEHGFSNRFYNSFDDTPLYIQQNIALPKLINLTDSILKFVFEWISDGEIEIDSNWRVDSTIVEELANCLWSWPSFECPIFDRLEIETDSPYRRTYVGPFKGSGKVVRYFADSLSSYFLGTRYAMPNKTEKCRQASFSNRTGSVFTYKVMMDLFDNSSNTDYCVVSPVRLSVAVSPAFEIDDYDFTSGVYSTWVESRWDTPALQVFLQADPAWEGAVFGVGLLILLISLVVVHLIARGSDVLFASIEPTPL